MNSLLIKTFIVCLSFFSISDVYDIDITTVEETGVSLGEFKGKKIVIVVLPVTRTGIDMLFLQKLDSVSRKIAERVTVIGVPSYVDGGEVPGSELKSWYRSIVGPQVIITRQMYTQKSSGDKQDPLFRWLTNYKENGHFDGEVRGVGQKYYINEKGELCGVYGPEITIAGRSLKNLLQ